MLRGKRGRTGSGRAGFGARALHEDMTPLGIAKRIREGSVHQKLEGILTLVDSRKDGSLTNADSRMLLRESLDDSNESVRISAVLALADIGLEALPELSQGLKNEDPRVQSFSAACIYGIFASLRTSAFSGFRGGPDSLVSNLCELLEGQVLAAKMSAKGALKQIAWKMPLMFLADADDFRRDRTLTHEMQGLFFRLESIAKRSIAERSGSDGAVC